MKMLERNYDALTTGIETIRDQIHAVEITPTAKWFYEENDQEYWEQRKDFPTLAPPFPYMWMEFETPRFSRNGNVTIPAFAEVKKVGCMVASIEIEEAKRKDVVLCDTLNQMLFSRARHFDGLPPMKIERPAALQRTIESEVEQDGGARWWTIWKGYVESRAGELYPISTEGVYLSQLGRPFSAHAHITRSPDISTSWIYPFWFATALMHAKNVHLGELQLPEKLVRKREKEGKPVLKFRTLIIDPLRQITNSQPGSGGSGLKRALHFVRGHFKDFREHGLFGRHKDIYWWNLHARGNEESGKIIKDYSIVQGGL